LQYIHPGNLLLLQEELYSCHFSIRCITTRFTGHGFLRSGAKGLLSESTDPEAT